MGHKSKLKQQIMYVHHLPVLEFEEPVMAMGVKGRNAATDQQREQKGMERGLANAHAE